ncbi:allophanate hydrolase [Aliidiomarina sedimenti]|uniref:Allophanate hydrolase n=1 Tax=Aliidiomarina sedimenti TaxID=1933879 RepID=A0ABY0C0W8_9GAMM|nr:5-oxoprolinase subunit PxpB [Aliidiomarina sedimenti]RUO31506.1 allophanate hydrolase [Aliidiomarina sedimenti]
MSFKRPDATFELAGVNAILVRFGNQLNSALPAYLSALRDHLLTRHPSIISQVVPAYTTILVEYDPRQCRMYDLQLLLERELEMVAFENTAQCGKLVELPVVYGGEHGPDLTAVADACGLSEQAVIELHSGQDYQVYAQGFAPGFSYLAELPEQLRLPRLSTPRQKVAAGSVAIAEQQTAVYPYESPGGWHILGYTPITWFDPQASPMTPVEVGDRVRFKAVTVQQLDAWVKEQAR